MTLVTIGMVLMIISFLLPNTQTGIFVPDGHNMCSYVVDDGVVTPQNKSKIFRDGIYTDYMVLINPIINGEKVMIPPQKRNGESNHFFYIDNLQKVEGRVYRVKEDAQSHIEFNDFVDVMEDRIKWDYNSDEDVVFINPEINENGGNRVYIPNYNLWSKISEDEVSDSTSEFKAKDRHFFWRYELELIQR
ncbi:MAG: hypothetical protein Q8Q23_04230 [bacterium]|nr:hypothetical protein [bacterium]